MWLIAETSGIAAVAVGLLAVAAAALYAVYVAGMPTIPVKGKTNVPGFGKTLPIIGDAWRFFGAKDMIDVWNIIDEINAKYDVLSVWLGSLLLMFVGDPKMAEVLLNKTTHKPYDFYGVIADVVDGVFTRNGKEWQALRVAVDKLTHPTFISNNYIEAYEEGARKLCTILDGKCDEGIFNLNDYVRKIYVEILTESILGVPVSRLKDPEGFVERVSDMGEKAIIANINAILQFQQKVPLLKYFYKDAHLNKDFADISNTYGPDCLRVRQEVLKEKGINIEDPEYDPECYADVVLQIAKKENSRPERLYTMPVEMVAVGYDTPSVGLCSACLFLAMHPDIQEKAFQEQVAIMGDSLEPPTKAEVAGMTYMEMCIKETLRHVAPPGFARLVESEIIVDDYVFPEGCCIYVSTYKSRKNPAYWVKAEKFYPEHFLPEEIEKRPKGVYLPFSGGSRVCAGKHIAQMTIRIVLSTLLRRYEFSTNMKFENLQYKYLLMLEPAMGYPVRITRRRKQNS